MYSPSKNSNFHDEQRVLLWPWPIDHGTQCRLRYHVAMTVEQWRQCPHATECVPLRLVGGRRSKSIGVPIWFYMILAVVDVEGNYFAVKAFAYANYVTVG